MRDKIIWLIIIIILAVVGWYYYAKPKASQGNGGVNSSVSVPGTSDVMPRNLPKEEVVETVVTKEFTVIGKSFSFSPATMTVNKGNRVKITFRNEQGFHDFKIDGYNVSTQRIQGGSEGSVEFVADKTGSFEYYCSVGNHKEEGMKGTLIVR